MYDAATASDRGVSAQKMQRVRGTARIRFANSSNKTRLADLYQSGSAKVRLPKVYNQPQTAVLINTAGGLTGGDELKYDVTADEDTHVIVTSQTAERAYKSSSGIADVTGTFTVNSGAVLEWLPQETILFDASRLKRTISANLLSNARLLMVEALVLGRKAMGEKVRSLTFRDSWRIRRDGKLVFADDVRLDGDPVHFFEGPATASGGLAVATLVDCAVDAEDRLSLARTCIDDLPTEETHAAASAWNGLLTARFVSRDGRKLRDSLMKFLTGYRAAELPRVWYC
ncbi:urease accessory protein UreD [Roseibium sp. SCPC15]|jgi:urease accessory protein|uniref:urease accessory protein UreD n=1 Tax=Roseibium sp. SCP15 TaxID=3141376 RepID=UPI0033366A9F